MTMHAATPLTPPAPNGGSSGDGVSVRDRMSSPPITVRSDAPIGIVATLLDRHGITGLPVVDPTGALVGVVSEVDLARFPTGPLSATPRELLVRHVMSAPAVTVRPSDATALAVRRIERHRVRRLVVVSEDDDLRPIGVVTAGDLAATTRNRSGDPDDRSLGCMS